MLVVPFGLDQPDNGARVQRLGAGRMVARRRYRAERVAAELRLLLGEGFARRGAEVGAAIRAEDGAGAAADALERVLGRSRK
jgi:UDP:flavonoid glycosyltransferase YjiC (YdhE family)